MSSSEAGEGSHLGPPSFRDRKAAKFRHAVRLLGRSGWGKEWGLASLVFSLGPISSLLVALSGLYSKRRELTKVRAGGRSVLLRVFEALHHLRRQKARVQSDGAREDADLAVCRTCFHRREVGLGFLMCGMGMS